LVLLASHEGAQYIRQQLDSILAQTGVEVEILIADDASSDATVDAIRTLNNCEAIHLQQRLVGTGSAAQNFVQLIREADVSRFDYIALSDQDDIWMTGKLRRATDALAASISGGYSSSVVAKWPDGSTSRLRQSARLREADFLFEGAGQGCTFVLTKAFFDRVQGLFRRREDLTAPLIYHDWAIYALARSLNVPWVFDSEPSLWYRQHSNNDTGARGSISGLRRRLQLILGGQYRAQISAVTRLCFELTPESPVLHRWKNCSLQNRPFTTSLRKAIFCFLHGRRRLHDRVLTSLAALARWI